MARMGAAMTGKISLFAVAGVLAFMLIATCEAFSQPQDSGAHAGFRSLQQFRAAYARIAPGITAESELDRLGFNLTAPDARTLSYLGVMEHFMPRDSQAFDRLDPAMRSCFEAPDGCTARIFRMTGAPKAKIVLLIHDGRVAYKAISGVAGRDACACGTAED
jgi:hypothetical protein